MMRNMSHPWARQARDLDRPQNEIPKDLISKSGRIRKLRDFSQDYSPGRDKQDKGLASMSTSNSPVTTATNSTENSNDSERAGTVTVKMEPISPVNGTSESETVRDNKSRVNLDLLQKALTESVEEWFSYTEVVKSNKGKPYKKRKIVMPPLDESDFSFELRETKDAVTNQGVRNESADSKPTTADQQPGTSQAEEFRKSMALKITQNDKLRQLVVRMAPRKVNENQSNGSERRIEDIIKKEREEPAENANTEMRGESSRTVERSENENEKTTTGNGINKNYRHFFALILYGDKIDGKTEAETRDSNSRQEPLGQQQGKTVIKTLDLETADLKDFEVELSDFNKLPKDSPMFECMSGIEKLLKTGANQSTVQKLGSAGSANVAPNSDSNKSKGTAGTSNMLPSRRRKMNEKVQECLVVLRKDIVEKYKRKLESRMKEERQEIRGERNNEKEARETVVDQVKDKKPKRNESVDEEAEEEEMNESTDEIDAKDEAEQKEPEMKVVADTKTKKATIKKQMDSEKDNGTSEMRLKKRKRFSPRKNDKLFSYVNNMKRKSGFKCSTDSAESQSVSNEELTREPMETIQETRVDEEKEKKPKQEAEVGETTERRMSRREIKLTPKLVHMIATSHKRPRKSPSGRENSVEEADYEYPNLIKKVVSGSLTQEVAELSSSANPIENYLQSKMDANASSLECNWKPGDLVWARFAGNPFWPSLILRDPFGSDEFTKVRHLGRLLKTFVHLQFLSDSGRRAWVPEPYCMIFKGFDEFEKMKSKLPEISSFTKRNDILYQKAFFPTKKMEKAWLDAVKEGEALFSKSRDERITYMKIKYPLVKYTETVTNGHGGCNGTTVDESKKSQMGTRKRKTRSSSWVEVSDWSNTEEGTTAGEPMSKTNESFECVTPTEAENDEGGDERASPKITLRLVRSTKKEEEKEWSQQEETIGGRLVKRPKKDGNVTTESVSNSGLKPSVRNQNGIETSKGRRAKQVCQVCLKMVENKRVVKSEEVCLGLVPNGAEVPSLEAGAGLALRKRKRRRKFSSPRVNRWKQKLWAIFNFYKEFGGCKREGMDAKRLIELYHSLCRNRMGKRRRPTKLRRNK